MKLRSCANEELTILVDEMALEIVKSVYKNCPKHPDHEKLDIMVNIICSTVCCFILNFTDTTEIALKSANFFNEAIKKNIIANKEAQKKHLEMEKA